MSATDGRDGGLEDHRARDVAHRQGVLALADPDDRVELLGQLGRDRRDDEGEQDLGSRRAPSRRGPRHRRTRPRRRRSARARPAPGCSRSAGAGRALAVRAGRPAAVEAMEAERREVLDVDRWVGLEMALDVPRVDREEQAPATAQPAGRLGRQEDGADRERVGDDERAACRAPGPSCRRASRRRSSGGAPGRSPRRRSRTSRASRA